MSNVNIPVIDLDTLEVEVPDHSDKFTEAQPAGDREFAVSGPKADAVRKLIFADLGLTRKQISLVAGCSVSRVGEVVWGLEHDGIEFPSIPLRETKPASLTAAELADAILADAAE